MNDLQMVLHSGSVIGDIVKRRTGLEMRGWGYTLVELARELARIVAY